jgi:ubiquinone/menaquinone biosynthesis C-methylase UbiE
MINIFTPLYRLMEIPFVYSVFQRINPRTVGLYREILNSKIKVSKGEKLLDIGCGTAQFRQYFKEAHYYGIDVNFEYMANAKKSIIGHFAVMHGDKIAFVNNYFENALCVSAFHHMSDKHVVQTVSEGLRVLKNGGVLHIIDSILPESFIMSPINSIIFHMDRGNFPRKGTSFKNLLSEHFIIDEFYITKQFPHNVCYLQISKKK